MNTTLKHQLLTFFCLLTISFSAHGSPGNVSPGEVSQASCSQGTSELGGDDSPNYQKFQQLLAKGVSADLSEFLILWNPARFQHFDGAYFFQCQVQPWGEIQKVNTIIPERCSPDVLYSWGYENKLKSLLATYKNNETWQGPASPGDHKSRSSLPKGTLFSTISPVATFSYGSTPVRLKLKSAIVISSSGIGEPDKIANFAGELEDYDIFNFNVIESWSFGTPEIYDEIVKDILRITSGARAIGYIRGTPEGTGVMRLLNAGLGEYGSQMESTLKQNLLTLIEMILKHQGQVNFAAGTCRNRAAHFYNVKPTYFNQ